MYPSRAATSAIDGCDGGPPSRLVPSTAVLSFPPRGKGSCPRETQDIMGEGATQQRRQSVLDREAGEVGQSRESWRRIVGVRNMKAKTGRPQKSPMLFNMEQIVSGIKDESPHPSTELQATLTI
uniref:Uncharacterized protein n=1 Tax=Knipowitschia caucasica TaxID=637954 RepID=A0AAV2JMP3_KNICA